MSIIRDQEKLNSRQLETLRRRNEREIKKIENMHQDYKSEVHKTHDGEILNLREEHARQIAQDNDKKEKIMSQLRETLDKTKDMTDRELKNLKDFNNKTKVEEARKLTEHREVSVAEHELHLEDVNANFNEAARKVHEDGKNRIMEREYALREELVQNEELFKDKIHNQTTQFTTRFRNEGELYEKLKNDQDNKFKKERISSTQNQQREMAKMVDQHSKHVEQRDKATRKDIKNQDLAFEKKYAEHLAIHKNNMSRLDEQNSKIVTAMKGEVTEKIMNTQKRSDDPFFRFTKLSPVITHHPDHVEVKVEIPEHSKQDLQLTTNTKEVVLNFNRRYDDSHSPEKGVVNKLHKVETYTSRHTTDYILDPKKVESSYQDGFMIYTIGRA